MSLAGERMRGVRNVADCCQCRSRRREGNMPVIVSGVLMAEVRRTKTHPHRCVQ
jgi:hypothetical protein